MEEIKFNTIEEAIEEFKNGRGLGKFAVVNVLSLKVCYSKCFVGSFNGY